MRRLLTLVCMVFCLCSVVFGQAILQRDGFFTSFTNQTFLYNVSVDGILCTDTDFDAYLLAEIFTDIFRKPTTTPRAKGRRIIYTYTQRITDNSGNQKSVEKPFLIAEIPFSGLKKINSSYSQSIEREAFLNGIRCKGGRSLRRITPENANVAMRVLASNGGKLKINRDFMLVSFPQATYFK